MGTSSTINLFENTGDLKTARVKRVPAHWDGYYSYAGMQLLHKYRNPQAVQNLFNYGSISRYGAPLSELGITAELYNKGVMYKINKVKWQGRLVDEYVLLCEVEDFIRYYCYDDDDEKVHYIDNRKFLESLKKYNHTYDYCYIGNWWYVSEKVNGKSVLVPLTYNLCEYMKDGYFCIPDVVIRNADTGMIFTYDYYTRLYNKDEDNAVPKRSVMKPSVRLINKIVRELEDERCFGNYRTMLEQYVNECRKASRKVPLQVVPNIAELPMLSFPQNTLLFRLEDKINPVRYTFVQSSMRLLSNTWSASVQVLCDLSEKTRTVNYYCRLNLPEFEEAAPEMLKLLQIAPKDICIIDGLKWVKVTNKLWTQEQYAAFIDACDKRIKAAHKIISL